MPMTVASRLANYRELSKPRIVTMVLVTTGVGFLSGCRGSIEPVVFLATMAGTACFAASASVLNQAMERKRDARMRRTAGRPIPSGRTTVQEAVILGLALLLTGVVTLNAFAPQSAFWCAATTWILYLAAYTPLKPISTINTVVGAIPGALPPVIGWTAATGTIRSEAVALFLILFLWQFPHFLAIAWLHRRDYRRGGYKMITHRDPAGWITSLQSLGYASVLVPVAILPFRLGMAGPLYLVAALILSLHYWVRCLDFVRQRDDRSARRMLYASLYYLPLVYLFLILNPLPA
jgi:protoheme IX farnesyltransferase